MNEIIRQLKRTFHVLSGFPSVQSLFTELHLFLEFVESYRANQYRSISPATLFVAALGVIYLFSPIDLLPDYIPVLGWIDDIAILRVIIEVIRTDLKKFKIWKEWMAQQSKEYVPNVE